MRPTVTALALVLSLLGSGRAFAQQQPDSPNKETPKPDEKKQNDDGKDGKKDEKAAPVEKDANAEVKKKLASQKVSVCFDETPLAEVFAFLRDISGVNVVADPGVDGKATVTLKVQNVTLEQTLTLVAAAEDGLGFEVWRGVVWFRGKDAKKAPPAPDLTDAGKAALEKKLTVSFEETKLSNVVEFLSDFTGVAFEAGEGCKDEVVSLQLRDATLADALDVLCRVTGTKVAKSKTANVLRKR